MPRRSPLIGVWITAALLGLVQPYAFEVTPGETATIQLHPSVHQREANRVQLILFGHPRCPCTRTTLQRLQEMLAQRADRVPIKVVFVCPWDADASWTNSSTARLAQQLPGAEVIWDRGAQITAQYGAKTSGHLLAFHANGNLAFSGGITRREAMMGQTPARSKCRTFFGGP